MTSLSEKDLTPTKFERVRIEQTKCPVVPNFIETTDGHWVGVEEFTEAELIDIAKLWRRNLLNKATKRRRS